MAADRRAAEALLALDTFQEQTNVLIKRINTKRKSVDLCERHGDRARARGERMDMEQDLRKLVLALRQITELGAGLEAASAERNEFHRRLSVITRRVKQVVADVGQSTGLTDAAYGDAYTSFASTSDRDDFNFYSNEMVQDDAGLQTLKARAERTKQDAATCKQIASDIGDLNDIMQNLQVMVHEQGEMVDNIEDNIEKAQCNVKSANRNLKQAAAYKSARYPLVGGALGAAVAGGPVGLAVGAGWAALAATTGAVAGWFGGRAVKSATERSAKSE